MKKQRGCQRLWWWQSGEGCPWNRRQLFRVSFRLGSELSSVPPELVPSCSFVTLLEKQCLCLLLSNVSARNKLRRRARAGPHFPEVCAGQGLVRGKRSGIEARGCLNSGSLVLLAESGMAPVVQSHTLSLLSVDVPGSPSSGLTYPLFFFSGNQGILGLGACLL